jgi:hypothetical protein
VRGIGNVDNKMIMDNKSETTSIVNELYIVRSGGAVATPLTLVTILMPYVHPPNEPNATTGLKGTKL